MKALFKLPGALAYLTVIFLNAFVDLGHKITLQNTIFKVYDGHTQIILTAVINGLILLPFILLFSPAGYIADRYAKNKVMRVAAWFAVFITCAITLCYYQGWFWPAFILTFLLAVQSAIYSPAKYGYIKGLFGKEHLAEANGLVQAITIGAILLGTFLFSVLFESWFPHTANTKDVILTAIAPIGWLLVINSIFELLMAYRLPATDKGNPQQQFVINDYLTGKLVAKNLQPLTSNKTIKLSVIGLAIFWSVGQVILAAFPAFAKQSLAIDNTIVIQGILATIGIGIVIGSTLAAKWSKGYIETGLIPIGAAGISLGLILLTQLSSVSAHALNFLFIGFMGGLFIIPLNALIQFNAKNESLGTVLAGNNLIQNISMLAFLVLTAIFAIYGLSSKTLLLLMAAVAVLGGLYTIYKLPQSLARIILSLLMTRRYKINVQGLKNIPEQGGTLLLGNHISWVDWAIIQIASPRPVRFVMLKSIYQRWYLTWFFKLFGVIPIESGPSSRNSLNTIADLLNKGHLVCLFPEGSISRTGHLAEFRKGFERACEQCNNDVVIVPFYLRGLWGSQFSRSSDQLKTIRNTGLSRDLIVAFGEPLPKSTTADVLKRRVFDISISSWQEHTKSMNNLADSWIDTVKRVGSEMAIADTLGTTLSARQALTASIAFSKRIQRISPEQNIGLLLPTSAGGVLANMAVLLSGKTVVNLNFTASLPAFISSIEQAGIKTIYSSKKFISKLERKGIDIKVMLGNTNVVYLEDLKASISKLEMLRTLFMVKFIPSTLLKLIYSKPIGTEQTAAILFSSGSEGQPKGIMLSHKNIMANLKQISDVLNTQNNDVVMASLPLFHAFGLTVTQFMPLIEGIPLIAHADPTDVLGTAKAIAKFRGTILFGTSTFLRLYTKNTKVNPLALESLRIVVAGAERLNPDIRDAFQAKFNKTILEGYGATETTPVASVNLPDALDTDYWQVQLGGKLGTVGMPLPGTSFKIVDPDTWQEVATGEDGMILIGGCQVMHGYLNDPEKTEQVIKVINGVRWYITGDKGRIDSDGFLTIIDRYSRFAKLGGEMISLSSVEDSIRLALNNSELELVAVNLPDDKKGEKIIALIAESIDPEQLKQTLLSQGCQPLMIPSSYIQIDEIPKLGSGKTDYAQAKSLALAKLSA
ncbi:acyl-[ACP]--phospholipid O-acyltransferase [Dasania sp. GY-MA-18]|uniref:Acyl-[ACP]--phospholipid O-acyltransferase n=1 Tax=Dasania phycosphaerae TaxID=2950436 RepID=A0A9J6RKE5_9GAMM|nr:MULTISPECIES: acyl-[ACP]--phospholipid O-acyltransferase [Dasania]MCR8922535.1 acyl-[ACP]--phospholipid O-acyltransferase [Dasania sp. GY-MA-18]MCZ0864963.1 acyl-[ACP]--phospholipid O-acyltransferase [Dasania phycosphaerae]MCZ0868691.1 acyl-[ACP]--phospholipid O-acyltransferase [Dasania phycosphaerae]